VFDLETLTIRCCKPVRAVRPQKCMGVSGEKRDTYILHRGREEEATVSVKTLVPEMVWTLWRSGKSLILPGIEWRLLGHTVHTVVNILMELSRFLLFYT